MAKTSIFNVILLLASSNLLVSNAFAFHEQKPATKPNIVLVMTDDQGYGQLGINDNPIIDTPNIDQLARESVSLTNFHVDPTCSPTRASLLTGKNSLKAGVWHTILTRYFLGEEHDTLAEQLKRNGYETAIFGKWHLGDNYPYRPQDQGFDNVIIHGGGGVGQTPDYWGNTQFDDVYYDNGVERRFPGYATDVWFEQGINFIKKDREKPFFAYISLNAPHGPYRAPKSYVEPYLKKGLNNSMATLYGMITNIDDNMAKLRSALKAQGLDKNTILIFMSDNGAGYKPTDNRNVLSKKHEALQKKYPSWIPNAGLKGYKGSTYEGGHKVPFYIHYPDGGVVTKQYNALSGHIDILPTLLDLAGLPLPSKGIDGISLKELLTTGNSNKLDNRKIVITNQRIDVPSIERPTVVAHKKWRYITFKGKEELYDLNNDPQQNSNVIKKFPEVAKQLANHHKAWWKELSDKGFLTRSIIVGNDAENPVRLNAMDWSENKGEVPWFIGHQAPAEERDYIHWITREDDFKPHPWYINVEKAGKYEVKAYYHDSPAETPVMNKYCVIEANNQKYIERVWGRASHCVANIKLQTGEQKVSAWFTDDESGNRKDKAAFYLYLNRL
ncbi:arylsulfatase [Thalassotalea sp. PLHSN55]|uniref:arylsulfatase n=1 Tax=Thalassotalea sp. PLHSN55 TaxID=3435888 RepID=UPI003F837FBB